MDGRAACGGYVIPDLIRRHRKLLRCLHPWTVKPVLDGKEPRIAMVIDDEGHNFGIILDSMGELNMGRLNKMIEYRRSRE